MALKRSVTTIAINMHNIETMMNAAINEYYIKQSQYPFGIGKYEIQTAEGVKKALSFEQINKIKDFKCEDPKLRLTNGVMRDWDIEGYYWSNRAGLDRAGNLGGAYFSFHFLDILPYGYNEFNLGFSVRCVRQDWQDWQN